jgi:hypothetical protein
MTHSPTCAYPILAVDPRILDSVGRHTVPEMNRK